MLKTALTPSAGSGTLTRKGRSPPDFESGASTKSIIPASAYSISLKFLPQLSDGCSRNDPGNAGVRTSPVRLGCNRKIRHLGLPIFYNRATVSYIDEVPVPLFQAFSGVAFALIVLSQTGLEGQTHRPGSVTEIQLHLDRLEALGYSGAVGVMLDGEVLVKRAMGYADLEMSLPRRDYTCPTEVPASGCSGSVSNTTWSP